MSQRAPQTLSVKRKRNEAPVDSLIFDNSVKRQRSEADIFFRRLTKPGDTPQDSGASTPATERRFHLDPVSRAKSRHVFIERQPATTAQEETPTDGQHAPVQKPTLEEPPRPRKRPGTRAASSAIPSKPTQQTTHRTQPSEHDLRELEALSHKLDSEETHPHTSPSKYKPKAPARRFAEREPEKAAALAAKDGDGEAMDVDNDDYVIDTYIREVLLPDEAGNLPTATGTVGFLVLNEEDEDWWNGSDSDDKEFDTDDDDSNAEEYYANDYPEDELSEDDEFDRNPWKANHRHGSDDEEFDANDSGNDNVIGSDEDEDDLHYKMTVPKAKRTGYWGMTGQ
ncbi:hypothetical protein SLS59_004475 [Nothophoma quercina]|uniref:Transcription factor Iwr1 domain-containing protein n=1 Tax=Nothophoma quercina TaxID=749835 RepID=A0ABR3RGG4_9PLEO